MFDRNVGRNPGIMIQKPALTGDGGSRVPKVRREPSSLKCLRAARAADLVG